MHSPEVDPGIVIHPDNAGKVVCDCGRHSFVVGAGTAVFYEPEELKALSEQYDKLRAGHEH
jgi:hypothetical protein